VPAKPLAPSTSILNNKVIIEWEAPDNAGSTIDSYSIQIQQKNGTFTPSIALCNGGNAGIVGLTTCTVPLLGLRADPYLLVLGDDVVV
jgi:hypothetical protein